MSFSGKTHKPESNAKRSATIKSRYDSGNQGNMGFKRKHPVNMTNRERQLKCRYGINLDEYNDMLLRQGGGCAICHAKSAYKSNTKPLFVDHCHKTGRVRGLLCNRCNNMISGLEDSETRFRAIQYIDGLLPVEEMGIDNFKGITSYDIIAKHHNDERIDL